jgi:hypothetical protein
MARESNLSSLDFELNSPLPSNPTQLIQDLRLNDYS